MNGSRFLEQEPIDRLYDWFADETASTSPTWEALCRWIARTPQVHRRLDGLPGQARQPNRLLAAVRFLDGPTQPGAGFVAWLDDNWAEVEHVIVTRTTQTNEPGRCAVVAPVLASLPQPVALLELGTSAGLCLLPDRYGYSYSGGPGVAGFRHDRAPRPSGAVGSTSGAEGVGSTNGMEAVGLAGDGGAVGSTDGVEASGSTDAVVFPCRVSGAPPGDPGALQVATRLGLDLNPLDPTDPDTRRWLRALVWPGEEDREERLAAALALAAADPPPLRQADLTVDPSRTITEALAELRSQAPEATPVIIHSAFLAYLSRPERQAVVDAIRASGARWVSFEGPRVVPGIDPSSLGEMPDSATFTVALGGAPLGWAQAHGRSVSWVTPPNPRRQR